MDIEQIINKHESVVDRQMARKIIKTWNEGAGTMSYNMVRFGLQQLAVGNKQLADEVHNYLQEAMGY